MTALAGVSARPFYEMVYHVEGWTLADAFRPQPGWGTRRFTVKLSDLPAHTEQEFVNMARQAAPERYRLTSVTLYPERGEGRVIWSTPPMGKVASATPMDGFGEGKSG